MHLLQSPSQRLQKEYTARSRKKSELSGTETDERSALTNLRYTSYVFHRMQAYPVWFEEAIQCLPIATMDNFKVVVQY